VTTLRDLILAEMISVEESDFARGVNQGLREALRVVEGHDCAASIKAALEELRAQGRKTGGDVPYGYCRAGDGSQTLVEDAGEQEVIAIARRLRAVGKTLREIAHELRRRGKRTRDRGPFDPKQISRMLKAPRFAPALPALPSPEVPPE
jgi:Recombinase